MGHRVAQRGGQGGDVPMLDMSNQQMLDEMAQAAQVVDSDEFDLGVGQELPWVSSLLGEDVAHQQMDAPAMVDQEDAPDKAADGKEPLHQERGAAAVKAAYLTYLAGVKAHGKQGSWETKGRNRGPLVDAIETDNHAPQSGFEWCGMYIGHSYKKAGIRKEILRNLVFWSGHRLHMFFTQGRYIGGRFGRWWQQHKTLSLSSVSGNKRKALIDGFKPQAGDVALFRGDYSHVGMVTNYDSKTGKIEIIEGNRGNRVQANVYDNGDRQITFLGRFNDSDYTPGGSVDPNVSNAKDPIVKHGGSGKGSTR